MNGKYMMAGALVVGLLVMNVVVAEGVYASRLINGDGWSPTPTPSEEPSPTPTPEEEKPNPPGDEQDCESSTNVDACGGGYTNAQPETPEPTGQVKGVEAKATLTPTPEMRALEVLPKTGANVLWPLALAGSGLAVAAVGFRKKMR